MAVFPAVINDESMYSEAKQIGT